jgi:predicted DNA binding CopG/RHH family protein
MKKTVKYTDEMLGDMKIVTDFLPSPKELIFKEDTVKITLSLTKESVEFFKKEAEKHHTQYQKMIRNLLDVYASSHTLKPVS